MKITLGFSPCPNDTFIFDAFVNNKIDTEGLVADVVLEDVQTLNTWAIEGRLDVSKISYGVLPLVLQNYIVLNSGSALGKGVGPLLISKKPVADLSVIDDFKIAIPGENTTAHLLFSRAFPNAKHKTFLVFNEIEDAVVNGKVDAGVIIHENRFTYQDKGLIKLMDLGAYWEQTTDAAIPLGGIVAKRNLPVAIIEKVNRVIKRSIEFAFKNYPELTDYIRMHAQEMSEAVMRKHIDLYVNSYSVDLGVEGQQAIVTLMNVYKQMHHLKDDSKWNIFYKTASLNLV